MGALFTINRTVLLVVINTSTHRGNKMSIISYIPYSPSILHTHAKQHEKPLDRQINIKKLSFNQLGRGAKPAFIMTSCTVYLVIPANGVHRYDAKQSGGVWRGVMLINQPADNDRS